jgi:hypothetical protein
MSKLLSVPYLENVFGGFIGIEEVLDKVRNLSCSVEEFDEVIMSMIDSAKKLEHGMALTFSLAGEYDILVTETRIQIIRTVESYIAPNYCAWPRQETKEGQ